MSVPRLFKRAILYLAAISFALWVLIPFIFIAVASFTPKAELLSWPKPVIPKSFSLETVRFFLRVTGVLPSLLNSILVALLTVGLSLAIGAPAGYALSRFSFRGRDAFRLSILFTRMFPVPLLAIPVAVTFIRWRLFDTQLGVAFVHTALALPFVVIITSGIFVEVPKELEEAAMTLGCGRLGAFIRVSLPLALPGLAAAAMFTFVISWNEVFAATILTLYNRTLPALIMSGISGAPIDFRFAGGFFMVVPALIFMFFIRRYLLQMWGRVSGR